MVEYFSLCGIMQDRIGFSLSHLQFSGIHEVIRTHFVCHRVCVSIHHYVIIIGIICQAFLKPELALILASITQDSFF